MARIARRLAALVALLVCSWACSGVVSTRVLANAFNGGALDSNLDHSYTRDARATDTVAWRMRDELGDGFFAQGSDHARVVRWLRYLERHADPFMREVVGDALDAGAPDETLASSADASSSQDADLTDEPADPSTAQRKLQRALDRLARDGSPALPDEPMCAADAPFQPDLRAMERLADYVRFRAALERATSAAAELALERFATMDDVVAGARRAFHDTAAYLAERKWKREPNRHVTGLVVKGGAATGIFSAGVVWVALHMIDECIRAGQCRPDTAGFDLASGTSTGATVVAAADVFHSTLHDAAARHGALRDYLDWYLCSSMNDLYCVRNHVLFNLIRGGGADPSNVEDSFLDFDGLAGKLEGAYHCAEMENPMELVLNTVDFRTGRLYSLSDQDRSELRAPWDVAKAVVSSAALPFIVRPTYHLPIDPVDAGRFAYLDGGIRSELPLLALVRRGVERLLVVSSDASVTGDSAPIPNALGMAIRYLDISTGGITESEIDHARTRVEASRLAEYEYCMALLADDRSAKGGAHPTKSGPMLCTGHCDAEYLCSGDFARACSRRPPFHKHLTSERIVAQTFQMTSLWRNADRVPSLPGYAFKPTEQRRLMLAGAEAARQKCLQIASALDIEGVDPSTLYAWCTPRLPGTVEQCGQARVDALQKSPDAPDCRTDDEPSPDAGSPSTEVCP